MQPCPRCQEPNSPEATFCNRCGSHLRGAENPLIDRIIGKYRLKDKIGGGGFGSVYRAEHIDLPIPFAVKILHPHFAGNPLMVERFKREARLLAGLRHENIVQIIDFGHMPSLGSYLIMEWLEGKTFQWHIQRFGIPPRHILIQIFEQLLGALDFAHRHGIVHRDLKPENLILIEGSNDRRTLKILDFGVARILTQRDENAPSLTETGLAVGTPRYMSPEQARGDIEEIDGRTDIYAAGVLLVELLTGRTLYGGTTNEILIQQIEAQPPSLQALAPQMYINPRLQAVVDRALAKDKHARFPTARAFSEALIPLLLEEIGLPAHSGVSVALSAIRQGVRIDPAAAAPMHNPAPIHLPQRTPPNATASPGSTRALKAPSLPDERPQHTAERYNGEKLSTGDREWLHEPTPPPPPPPPRNWLWGTVGLIGGLAATLIVFFLGTSGRQPPRKHIDLPAPPAPYRSIPAPQGYGAIQFLPVTSDASTSNDPTSPTDPPRTNTSNDTSNTHTTPPADPTRTNPNTSAHTTANSTHTPPTISKRPSARPFQRRTRSPRKRRTAPTPSPRPLPPQPAPSSSQRFALQLHVTPEGAEILVDGVRKAHTQAKLQAQEGQTLRILIRKDGYLSQQILWKAKRHERRKIHLAENIF